MAKILFLLYLVLSSFIPLEAQDIKRASETEAVSRGPEGSLEDLPAGFQKILLGMGVEEVRRALDEDGNFRYRGEPDVSILQSSGDALIECEGLYYIDHASFQFVDEKLFTITLIFDRGVLGYYTMFSTLQGKYGDPLDLSPDRAVWEDEKVRLALERPLRLKYIDAVVLERLRTESERSKSIERIDRERFLEQF